MKQVSNIITLLKKVSEKGFFNLLSANVLIQIVSFASQLLVAGILSPEDVGRIKILQTWLSLFSIVGSMGFASSTLKLCSENRDKNEINALLKAGLRFTLFTTIGSYILVLIINWIGLLSKDLLISSLVPIALFPLISNSFLAIYISYYQSQKQIKFISNITSVNKVLTVILIIVFTIFYGIKGYYIGLNIAALALVFLIYFISKSRIPKSSKVKSDRELFTTHWKYSRPSFFSVLLSELAAYADILILNFLMVGNMIEIGFYSFALTLTIAFKVLPATVQQITIPYFSRLTDDIYEFKAIYKRYSRILILILFATLVLALIFGPMIINFLFKGKYNQSMVYFIPLAIGWSIRQYNQIQSSALFSLGEISKIAITQLITLIFSVFVILVSFMLWGIMGVAVTSALRFIFEVSLFNFFLRRKLKA